MFGWICFGVLWAAWSAMAWESFRLWRLGPLLPPCNHEWEDTGYAAVEVCIHCGETR